MKDACKQGLVRDARRLYGRKEYSINAPLLVHPCVRSSMRDEHVLILFQVTVTVSINFRYQRV